MAEIPIDELHALLEDWARLEADFDGGPDSDPRETTLHIAERLRMNADRLAEARRVRNRCAHLDSSISVRQVRECREVLDEALMRHLSVRVLEERVATEAYQWRTGGRASRTERHTLLVRYVQLLNDAREVDELDDDALAVVDAKTFRTIRRIRDQISHPYPPPFRSDVTAAIETLEPLQRRHEEMLAAEAEAQRSAQIEAAERAENERAAQNEEQRRRAVADEQRRHAERQRVAREQREGQERAARDAYAEEDRKRREAVRIESERRARQEKRVATATEVGRAAGSLALGCVAKFFLSSLLFIVTIATLLGLSFIESGLGVLLMVIVGVGTTILQWWLWFAWWPE